MRASEAFITDYMNFHAVVALAKVFRKEHPKFPQYVVKYPNSHSYNLTMQKDQAIKQGAVILHAEE